MGKVHEAVKTFNSTVRTLLAFGLAAVLSAAAWWGYGEYNKHERELATATAQAAQLKGEVDKLSGQLVQLNVELQRKNEQIEKMETSLRLLKTDQRLAQLKVTSVDRDGESQAIKTTLEFTELSPNGDPISQPKRFELPGEFIYIDNWVIKFDDKYVEQSDLQRGTSLCLFKRIFSDQLKPSEGFALDEIGLRPQAYARGGQMSQFEKELWGDFWQFANDPAKAEAKGIRAANGEAVSFQAQAGKTYNLQLRASGGLSVTAADSTPSPTNPKAQ